MKGAKEMMILNPCGDIRDMDGCFNRVWKRHDAAERPAADLRCGHWTPAVDVYAGDTGLVLKVELPEVDRKDMSVTVDNNTLTIQGERKLPAESEREAYHRVERCYGTFTRSFALPNTVDQEKVKADYVDGVLKLVLPKKAELKPRQVAVNVS